MAVKFCPNRNELAFFQTTESNRKCSQCGYGMIVSPNSGKGGREKNVRTVGNQQFLAINVAVVEPHINQQNTE